MKRLILEQLTVYGGEIIEVRSTEDGNGICPVCGYLLHNTMPYGDSIGEDQSVFAVPGHDICPCCGTQFGDSDFPDEEHPKIKAKWDFLREAWLKSSDCDENRKAQLRNLGLYLD